MLYSCEGRDQRVGGMERFRKYPYLCAETLFTLLPTSNDVQTQLDTCLSVASGLADVSDLYKSQATVLTDVGGAYHGYDGFRTFSHFKCQSPQLFGEIETSS